MRYLLLVLLFAGAVGGAYFLGYQAAVRDVSFAWNADAAMQSLSTIQFIREGKCGDAGDMHFIELEKSIATLQDLHQLEGDYGQIPQRTVAWFEKYHLNDTRGNRRTRILTEYQRMLDSMQ